MKNNYTYVGKVDVSDVKQKLFDLDIWEDKFVKELSEHRSSIEEVHEHTQVVPLLWSYDGVSSLDVNPKHKYYEMFDTDSFIDRIKPHLESTYGNGFIIRMLFAKLKAGGVISKHKDNGIGLEAPHRVHIPIITNDEVFFEVGGEEKNMKEGEMWEINNQKLHEVDNVSEFDRIHIIVDYLSNGL